MDDEMRERVSEARETYQRYLNNYTSEVPMSYEEFLEVRLAMVEVRFSDLTGALRDVINAA